MSMLSIAGLRAGYGKIEVLHDVAEWGSDLLVIGPGSQPGRLSPITRTALHLSPCPVLVVHP